MRGGDSPNTSLAFAQATDCTCGRCRVRQLNYDLKRLQDAHPAGGFVTRRDRSYALAQAANALHEMGLRRLRATGLPRKHVDALVREWSRQELSVGDDEETDGGAAAGGRNMSVGPASWVPTRTTGSATESTSRARTVAAGSTRTAGAGRGRARPDGAAAPGCVRSTARGGDQVLAGVRGPRRPHRAEGVHDQGRPRAGDPDLERRAARGARRGPAVVGRRRGSRSHGSWATVGSMWSVNIAGRVSMSAGTQPAACYGNGR